LLLKVNFPEAGATPRYATQLFDNSTSYNSKPLLNTMVKQSCWKFKLALKTILTKNAQVKAVCETPGLNEDRCNPCAGHGGHARRLGTRQYTREAAAVLPLNCLCLQQARCICGVSGSGTLNRVKFKPGSQASVQTSWFSQSYAELKCSWKYRGRKTHGAGVVQPCTSRHRQFFQLVEFCLHSRSHLRGLRVRNTARYAHLYTDALAGLQKYKTLPTHLQVSLILLYFFIF